MLKDKMITDYKSSFPSTKWKNVVHRDGFTRRLQALKFQGSNPLENIAYLIQTR